MLYQVLEWVFSIVFVISAILLVLVVLLQEPKGGGIAEAFGGAGGETFGVRASGIARFTGWVAFVFMASAILIPLTAKQVAREASPFKDEPAKESVEPPPVVTPPANDGGADPAKTPQEPPKKD